MTMNTNLFAHHELFKFCSSYKENISAGFLPALSPCIRISKLVGHLYHAHWVAFWTLSGLSRVGRLKLLIFMAWL